ncbi:MAG: sensor histidine kinase [Marinilabiliaceae bacterium]
MPEEFKNPPVSMLTGGLKPTLKRILIVSLIGLMITVFVSMLFDVSPNPLKNPISFILVVVGFNLISEGNIIINRILDKKSPWFFRIRQRTRRQLLWSLMWSILVAGACFLALPSHIYEEENFFRSSVLIITFGFIFVLIFNSILFLQSAVLNWKQSVLEVEALKQAKLQSDYKVLQNQLNPHFLFNSFSTLISEIHYNPEQAAVFTQKLADVYRYLLQKRNDMTVPLREELAFLEDFIFLHKSRMGDALIVENKIGDELKGYQIPPLSLQMLIENAIKHNRASTKKPLHITLESNEEGELTICNNLQPKNNVYSTGTGLENVSRRYKMLSGKDIKTEETRESYCITLPLLEDYI